jgi:hypothetical protein
MRRIPAAECVAARPQRLSIVQYQSLSSQVKRSLDLDMRRRVLAVSLVVFACSALKEMHSKPAVGKSDGNAGSR